MWIGSVGMSVFNELSTRRDATIDQFSSKHPGTVNFAFVDGSVQQIRESVDYDTLLNLAGVSDGKIIQNDY